MVAAFDAAWQAVQGSGASFATNSHVEDARERLALRIIKVAQSSGIRDHIYLRDDALLYLLSRISDASTDFRIGRQKSA